MMVFTCPPAGKPAVDAAPGFGPPRPSWMREEAGGAWTLLAANFPQLVVVADLQDGGLWGPWMSGSEGAGRPHCIARL